MHLIMISFFCIRRRPEMEFDSDVRTSSRNEHLQSLIARGAKECLVFKMSKVINKEHPQIMLKVYTVLVCVSKGL